jgi:hypothetical protein
MALDPLTDLVTALQDALTSTNPDLEDRHGEPGTLVDGVYAGLSRIARALRDLGLADAATPFGAIEALCVELKDSSTRLAEGLNNIADAIREHTC